MKRNSKFSKNEVKSLCWFYNIHLYNIFIFMLVTSMELQLPKEFHTCRIECGENVNLRQISIPLILADKDVQFYWSIISASWEQGVQKALLSIIADLWITIHGFVYANEWVERHKRETKTCVQKTKGVRKHLLLLMIFFSLGDAHFLCY